MTLQTTPLGLVVLALLSLVVLASAALATWLVRTKSRRSEGAHPAEPSPDTVSQLRAQLQTLQHAQKALMAELVDCRNAIARIDRARHLHPERATVEAPRERATVAPRRAALDALSQQQSTPLAKSVERWHNPSAEKPPPVRSTTPPALELRTAPQPLPRPEPSVDSLRTESELSDEEIDALPPDLPSPGKPRKRILPPPKRPTLRSL